MEEILIKIIIYIVSCIVLIFCYSYAHEMAHREINYLYGIKSKIHITNKRFYTETENITQKQRDKVLLAHAINEVFGYPFLMFSIIITDLLLYLVIF